MGLVTRFEVERGYGEASADLVSRLPVPAKVVPVGPVLMRVDAANTRHLMRFGYLRLAGQSPQLWSYATSLSSSGESTNPDTDKLDEVLASVLASRETQEADIAMEDLKVEVVKLAYVDSESTVSILRSMGVNVGTGDLSSRFQQGTQTGYGQWAGQTSVGMQGMPVEPNAWQRGNTPGRIKNSDLPLVIRTPAPNPNDVGLVGAGSDNYMQGGSTGPNGVTTLLGATNKLATETLSSPTTQLVVMFNPNRPEQLGRIRKIISEAIDTPARQIMIEAMVMEIRSSDLEELGLQWGYQNGLNTLNFGALTAGSALNTLALARGSAAPDAVKNFYIKLEALVRDGKAQVLARPSVLTLDNRQAIIRVGTDIPIATSRDTSSATDSRVSYSFFYLPTGIQLNVRPRIDNDGKEVSMQIDAAVSATVANLGVEIRSPGAVVLAAAPGVSTRRVQTYARIPNSTPLIIGGLISQNTDETTDKTPLLGDLPVLGALFRAKRVSGAKQEVIIVLTPYIVDQSGSGVHFAMPKDAPAFDFKLNTDLFRSAVRLRSDDIPTTAFIRENARLTLYRSLVNRIAAGDPKLVEKPPLSLVLDKRTPGEQELVIGVLGGVLTTHYRGAPIRANQIMLYNQRSQGELVTSTLSDVLAKLGDGTDPGSFFRNYPDKCLAITFGFHRKNLNAGNVLEEPEPKIQVVTCARDRSDWKNLLYELNRNEHDVEFHTILLKDESDLLQLSRAIELRRIVEINGGSGAITLDNLVVGRVMALPEFGPNQIHTLGYVVARNFYLIQHYLQEFEKSFEKSMQQIDTLLRSGKYREYFAPEELPPVVR